MFKGGYFLIFLGCVNMIAATAYCYEGKWPFGGVFYCYGIANFCLAYAGGF